MAKSKQELLAKGKERRKKNAEDSKKLKLRKNWYETTDIKKHFKRNCRKPHQMHIHKALTPGQIVILLSGRFRGRRVVYLKNFRRGLATNSSSTHSIIYRNEDEMFKDMNIFELNYYDRFDSTIAASREAKIKYVLANVWCNEKLVELLSNKYPEMREYFPLIREEVEMQKKGDYSGKKFGMYYRGSFSTQESTVFSYDFCCDLIDDDEKIIIGGSDERDFVYETANGHKEVITPNDINYDSRDRITKNGNYYYAFGTTIRSNLYSDYCKLRFAFNKETPVPEYPELIDLKITSQCNHNCPMCFEGSTKDGKHADIEYLKYLVRDVSNGGKQIIEYSIGGGNILLYPELETLFKTIKKYNGYVNVTIKVDDTKTILENEKLLALFKEYVDGCGVSVFNEEDAKKTQNFNKLLNYSDNNQCCDTSQHRVHIVAHIIPEYIGYKTAKKIKDCLSDYKYNEFWKYIPVLYLGYKTLQRGKTQAWEKLTDKQLENLFGDSFENIDTLFGQRYKDWLSKNFEYKYSYTRNEGEYSLYVDAVNKTVYMSSYNLERPYEMTRPFKENILGIFNHIREDNGFEVYNENNKKHYWDE